MTTVYTYTAARQNLATLLDRAAIEAEVRSKRRNGQVIVNRLETAAISPPNVGGNDLDLSAEEIVAFVAEGRRYK